jgi:IS6 family transposase
MRFLASTGVLVLVLPVAYADLAELLAECGIHIDPSTIFDWVQHFTPLYQEAARHHRQHVAGRLSADESYLHIAGHWCYVFRAIDEAGQVIDVYASSTRDTAAALAFLTRAMASTEVTPYAVTTGRAPIYPPAVARVLPDVEHSTGTMIQQRIERDHQHLKGRYRSMRGFQTVPCAQVVCAGHGFMRNLRDGFYRLGLPTGNPRVRQAPRLVQAWHDVTRILVAG